MTGRGAARLCLKPSSHQQIGLCRSYSNRRLPALRKKTNMKNESNDLFGHVSFGGKSKKSKKRKSKGRSGTTRGTTDSMGPTKGWVENNGKGAMSGGGTAGGDAPGSNLPQELGGSMNDIPH